MGWVHGPMGFRNRETAGTPKLPFKASCFSIMPALRSVGCPKGNPSADPGLRAPLPGAAAVRKLKEPLSPPSYLYLQIVPSLLAVNLSAAKAHCKPPDPHREGSIASHDSHGLVLNSSAAMEVVGGGKANGYQWRQ